MSTHKRLLPLLSAAMLLLSAGFATADEQAYLDRGLMGGWRHTISQRDFVADHFLTLKRNGTYTYSYRTESKVRGYESPVTRGRWACYKGQLILKPRGKQWKSWGTYKVGRQGRNMVLTYRRNTTHWVR